MQIKHYHFETIDSTNNWAKSHVQEFNKKELTYITADFQTNGRGRFNRTWISPPDENLLATFCLWLGQFDFNLPQVLALAAADMLKERGFEVKLKWPNDFLINGKKLGGILTESLEEEAGRWMVLGIGMNINMNHETLRLIPQSATSLFAESGQKYEPAHIGRVLAAYFERSVAHYHSFNPFYERFKAKLLHEVGDKLKIGQEEGIFKSFNPDGSITLLLNTGAEKVFISGEILD